MGSFKKTETMRKIIIILLGMILLYSCIDKSSSHFENKEVKKEDVSLVENNVGAFNATQTIKKLQGTWINIDDPLSSLTFQGNKVINAYNETEVLNNIMYNLSNQCATEVKNNLPKDNYNYIVTSGDSVECYFIEQLDDENLVLKFLGIETLLRFKKE